MAIIAFSLSVLFLLYVLIGYPLILAWLASRKSGAPARHWIARPVSVVMPVHNGEPWLSNKLRSIAALDYPRDLIQVIVVDDGSTDSTGAIASTGGVELVTVPRGGKAAALNAGIARAKGEILLLTDVRQSLERDSLRRLVECFSDPDVGVISGELVIRQGSTQQEADIGLYWRYEKWMRKNLSAVGSVFGATGCLYAMRRQLAVPLPPNTLLDDVYLPISAFFKGYRVLFLEAAKAYDFPTALRSEFKRKVRTLAGVYQIVLTFPRLLLPTTRLWFHFVSHKVARLFLPHALIVAAVSSAFLPVPWGPLAVWGQGIFYGIAVLDSLIPDRWRLKRVSSIARSFIVLMTAAFCAPAFLFAAHRGSTGWSATTVEPARGANGS